MSALDWEVRAVAEDDRGAVRDLLVDAFGAAEEADLVDALRRDGDAEIELLAETEGRIIGYLMLSAMRRPERALGLGPVATAEPCRRQGVARSLIESGLALGAAGDWTMVFLLGDPAFYSQFGFATEPAQAFPSAYSGPYWQLAFLDEEAAPKSGDAEYARAFSALCPPE